ncbi:MAG: RluA family pseudouridine synthase [Dehalococcoidia bacterium]|nr:RluA family pseudouridine synthase [Dehalococcoidia bacterium]
MDETLSLKVVEGGERLDKYITRVRPELTRSHVQRLIEQGCVMANGQVAKSGQKLRVGDELSIVLPPPAPTGLEAESIPLTVVYEDADLLVVDKPAGMVVHPAPGHPRGTLVNALLAHIPDLEGINGSLRPGIVHRLDKDTSGLIVVAKNGRAHEGLAAQFKKRTLKKQYLALVHGQLSPAEGAIEAPVGRDPAHRQRMAVVEDGREARTGYRVVRSFKKYSLLEVSPASGRTHQVRVHLSAIGHPVVGDRLYGGKISLLERQFLHASYLAFEHPISGKHLEFRSSLPADLEAVLERIF